MSSISKKLLERIISSVLLIAFTIVFSFNVYAVGGELDTTFSASAFGALKGQVRVIKVQPDGKVLVGGNFTEVKGYAASGIARFNTDGSIDRSFNAPDFYGNFGLGDTIHAIDLQTDGKILVGGSFLGAGDIAPGLRRLNSDGSLDTSFNIREIPTTATVRDIVVQPNGKILVGGLQIGIFRLNADGTQDNTFIKSRVGSGSYGVRDIELQADGNILICGGNSSATFVERLFDNGEEDPTFFPPNFSQGSVERMKVRPNGKIVVVGAFNRVNSGSVGHIYQINADGSTDPIFTQSSEANFPILDVFLRDNGKIIVVGNFSFYNGVPRERIAQINVDGTLDTSLEFDLNANLAQVNDVEVLPNGEILTGAFVNVGFGKEYLPLTKFDANGVKDLTFEGFVNRSGRVNRIIQQPDGKMLVAGEFAYVNGIKRYSVARMNLDGSLDTTFVPFFNDSSTVPITYALALQSDGKILIGSINNNIPIYRRMNSDGTQDTTFSSASNLLVYDIVPLANGQILIAGGNRVFGFLRRLNADGSVDTTLPSYQFNDDIHKIFVQSDGKILVAGRFTEVSSTQYERILRINTDDTIDNTFDLSVGTNDAIYDIDVQSDGKIVVGGAFTTLKGINQVGIGRLNTDGSLDTGFVQNTNAPVNAVKIQKSGKILIGGLMSTVQGEPHNGIARLNSNGTVDNVFNTFANMGVYDIQLQTDGKILISGEFTKINQQSAVRIARLQGASVIPGQTLFDYDGDGRADISVFRPIENKWYILRSSDGQVAQQVFAISGDIPTPADYDGDGKTDLGIFRPDTGDWWSLSTSDGVQRAVNWGISSDIQRPSDFDGDGKADQIIFRPSENSWYRFGSTGVVSIVNFGLAEDKPVTGDFDGDGKTDVAIYRPSTGDWWWQSSVDNTQRVTHFGSSTDIATPADFDGDGKTDFAVYRPSTGVWYILNSSNGSATIIQFGISEDKPVAADYDGDGRADIAVFRPSTGIWYLLQSTQGFSALKFGLSSDIPTPNAFVP